MNPGSRTAQEALALGLAHAIGIVLVSHCHYFVPPPTRLVWFAAEFGLAAAIWLPCRWFVRRVLLPAHTAAGSRWPFILLPAGLGFGVSRWWAGSLADTLWVHEPAIIGVMEFLLAASQAAVLASAYAGLLAVTVWVAGTERKSDRTSVSSAGGGFAFGLVLFFVAANVFTVWYVRQERTMYYWDYMGYWTKSAELAGSLRCDSPAAVWDNFRRSVKSDDYGPLPAVLPAAAIALFGDTRLVYVLAVVNLYLGELAIAAWLFIRRFGPPAGPASVAVPLLAVLFSPLAWVPALRGYPDIGGVGLAILALAAYLSRPAGRLPWPRIVLLAAILVAMVLFRRWYSFFVVAFFLIMAVESGAAAIGGLRAGQWELVRRVGRSILVVVWSGVLLVSFAAGWMQRAATTDYSSQYVAYKSLTPLADRVLEWFQTNGPLYVSIAAAGFFVLLFFRDTRRAALVVCGMVPIMLFHFLTVQNFGPHHDYLFLPALVLLPSLALVRTLAGAGGWAQLIGVFLLAVVGAMLTSIMFIPAAQPLREPLRPFLSTWYYPPLVRDDLDEFRRLLRATEAAAAATEGGRVTVTASSLTVSGSMFLAADRSLGEPLLRSDRLVLDSDIDIGFPSALIRADVAVVAIPTQTHLRQSEQQGVILTADSLLNGSDIGAAFERLPGEYRLGDGVAMRIYRRVRPTRGDELSAFCKRLQQAHPARPVFFTPPPHIIEHVEASESK